MKIQKLNDHFNRLLPYFPDKESGDYDETKYNAFIEDLLFGDTQTGSNPDPDVWINEALSPQGFASMINGAVSNAYSAVKKKIPVEYRKAETKEEYLEQKKRKAEKARKKKCSASRAGAYNNPDEGVKGSIKNLLGMCNGNC